MAGAGPGGLTARRPWDGRRILLGVTGGIAAYKVVQVARDLTQLGAEVDVVMTRSARAFVGEVSFEGVTGRPVRTEILAPGSALDHIRLARAADVVCVAPATADFMARAARGHSGDLLGAILLATRAPVLICPAMNDAMWSHSATLANAERLAELGYGLVGPAEGPLAYGEGSGPGRMESPEAIIQHVGRSLEPEGRFRARKVVITAGPTREAVDPVRFLSNRSSGRMGFALAASAWRRGAEVTLIAGPTLLDPPVGPRTVSVETAAEMRDAVEEAVVGADVLIMAAAIADFRPKDAPDRKIKKETALEAIPLEPAPDVLTETASARPSGCVVVGFALETDDAEANARKKLASKGLDLIVLNETGPETGFEVDTNRVTLIEREGELEAVPLLEKEQVADRILDRVERRLPRLDDAG
ncbi:MAG: bifunctional phosphopantothenoylcysteine decarboxylase/phosphopantothenate--cysteine ligase CoaBC [Longimicrobiales bacterium]|nr:bifunctional phosphopantothenoylcysteine decarboxylase/phosphopantothenate--cysteine ligase CoaBC [Longimicrobiales bacterium]